MDMEDHKLIALFFERSEQAITALTLRFGNRLYATAYNILNSREDAEEAVSDTYLALWNAIPPEKPDPLEGYVYRTGRNIALKKLRFLRAQKRSSQYDISLDELSSVLSSGNLEDAIDARELGLVIDRFLTTLPKQSRILFLRRYWFGDSVKQLSKDFSLTENTVSVRLSRIRTQLKTYLIKEGFFL
jgi:RNA polymerase sigma-70 factor (ECF subfamily)